MIFIGVIESNKDKKTIKTIKSILIKFNYKIIFKNELNNILCLKQEEKVLVIINIDPKYIKLYKILGIKFDILIHNFVKEEEYGNKLLYPYLQDCKYYILNSDDINLRLLPLNSLNGLVLNYGYNRKSSLTISSYTINESIKANLFLQRSLESISNENIEPFEYTVEINSQNKKDIYPVLASTALNLILFNRSLSMDSYKTIKM